MAPVKLGSLLHARANRVSESTSKKTSLPVSAIRWDSSELPDWITLVVLRANPSEPKSEDRKGSEPVVRKNFLPVDFHLRVGPKRLKIPILQERSVAEESKDQE